MLLSDKSIREAIAQKRIRVEPFEPSHIQPSSIDIRLDKKFLVFKHADHPYIDLRKSNDDLTTPIEITGDKPFILHPGEFVLGSTFETVTLPSDLAAMIEGKSSLGRLGILIHSTAGFISPGWSGKLTLEISNVAKLPVTLYYLMKIGQISFVQMTTAAERPYGSKDLGSKYYGSEGAVASKAYADFKTISKKVD
ncbi:dCTP deaminase [Candidatus Woesearchaeota archaeon]|nr:dCTP deaminase [Candidatus Woesearchaeota archaeon]